MVKGVACAKVLCVGLTPLSHQLDLKEPFMFKFDAHVLGAIMSIISKLEGLAEGSLSQNPGNATTIIKTEGIEPNRELLKKMKPECEKISLSGACIQIDFIMTNLPTFTISQYQTHLKSLNNTIYQELNKNLFLYIPSERSKFFNAKQIFGEDVEKVFPLITEDISEASKCLAMDRSTACVFHLMRIMEIGVQLLGTKLGVSLASEKNWQVILDQIGAAIKKLHGLKDSKEKEYAEAASHLYNVKVAWRNEVMHPKQTYTAEEAEKIFDNVKTFIKDLVSIVKD